MKGCEICDSENLYHTIPDRNLIENIVGKAEKAGNQHFFLLFPQRFLTVYKQILPLIITKYVYCRINPLPHNAAF